MTDYIAVYFTSLSGVLVGGLGLAWLRGFEYFK